MTGKAGSAGEGILEEVVRQYLPHYAGTPEQGAKGWNNTTRFVDHDHRRYVLRVYETHRDPAKIKFEHAVLLALAEAELSFRTPVPLLTTEGETLVRLKDSSGRYACLFAYIEGLRPTDEDIRPLHTFGEAAGELSAALAVIAPKQKPAYRPYYELGEAYPLCKPERVFDLCSNPPAELLRAAPYLTLMAQAYAEILRELGNLRHLPHQLVHGDLNASNLLVRADEPDVIEALLDFEFCTYDIRAMDAAVILSGLPEGEEALHAFAEGFRKNVALSEEELQAIPLLMRLRKVDVFLHFLTRYWEGIDDFTVLEEQACSLSRDLERMRASEQRLKRLLSNILI
ncbi:phosphotransferase enzyme family protein [Saccharibacillus sacchari]|uniref:Phosphotransferase n=1 Tax=Saccharibacillus sacchari TaxID=456493 RepID=A0ACC6PEU1_9BACL